MEINRVATNLENLEYSGMSLNTENSGNSQGILCSLREKLYQKTNKQSILVCHSNICVKQLLTGLTGSLNVIFLLYCWS